MLSVFNVCSIRACTRVYALIGADRRVYAPIGAQCECSFIVLEKDNTPFNYPILNSCNLKTVSSTDAYLNLDDCILHYSPMCSLNFVHIVRIVRLTLRFILCNRFYVLLLHSICNSVRMTCLIKRLLILLILSYVCGGAKFFGSALLQPACSVCVSLSAFSLSFSSHRQSMAFTVSFEQTLVKTNRIIMSVLIVNRE